MFTGLTVSKDIYDVKAPVAQPKVLSSTPSVAPPVKPAGPKKPMDAWEMGKDLIKF